MCIPASLSLSLSFAQNEVGNRRPSSSSEYCVRCTPLRRVRCTPCTPHPCPLDSCIVWLSKDIDKEGLDALLTIKVWILFGFIFAQNCRLLLLLCGHSVAAKGALSC